MIRFEHLTKSFWVNGKRKVVIDDLNLELPSGKSLALIGGNGAGKSTLLQLIAGTMTPDSGQILSDGTISWPVGLASAFHSDLSGAQNVRFVARIYGVDTETLVQFAAHFADIGEHFYMPFGTYSSGMKSRVAFGTVMGIQFDTYLVDEVTAVGDASFRRKSRAVFKDRVKNGSAIMVSHNMNELSEYCDAGIVLDKGKVQYFEDVEEAIALHEENLS